MKSLREESIELCLSFLRKSVSHLDMIVQTATLTLVMVVTATPSPNMSRTTSVPNKAHTHQVESHVLDLDLAGNYFCELHEMNWVLVLTSIRLKALHYFQNTKKAQP